MDLIEIIDSNLISLFTEWLKYIYREPVYQVKVELNLLCHTIIC